MYLSRQEGEDRGTGQLSMRGRGGASGERASIDEGGGVLKGASINVRARGVEHQLEGGQHQEGGMAH